MGSFELMAKLGLNSQPFERGLASVKSQVNSLGEEKWSAFKKAFTFGAIVEGIREVSSSMVELKRTAEDRGVSTDFLQGFRNAAKKFGNTAEDADNALDKLLVKIGEAREQGGSAAEAFDRYGVALKNANGENLTGEEVLRQIADKYKDAGDASSKAALAHEFFSRSGIRIHEVLAMGSSGLDDYISKQKELGKVLDSERVNSIAEAYRNVAAAQQLVGNGFAQAVGRVSQWTQYAASYWGAIFGGANEAQAHAMAAQAEAAQNLQEQSRARAQVARQEQEELKKLAEEFANISRAGLDKSGDARVIRALGVELQARFKLATMADGTKERIRAQSELDAAIRKVGEEEKRNNDFQIARLESEVKLKSQAVRAARNEVEDAKARNLLQKAENDLLDAKNKKLKDAQELAGNQFRAQQKLKNADRALAEAKGERVKYTLEELSTGNEFGVKDTGVASDIVKARELRRILDKAGAAREAGDTKEAARLFQEADDLRGKIESLRDEERYPFKALEEAQKDAAQSLRELNDMAKGKGLPVVPVMGK